MSKKAPARIEDHFVELTDPRRRPVIYPLVNIVTIAICAVICGADDFVAIAEFGRAKKKFLERFLDLSAGIPSHDRFNAIFRALIARAIVEVDADYVSMATSTRNHCGASPYDNTSEAETVDYLCITRPGRATNPAGSSLFGEP